MKILVLVILACVAYSLADCRCTYSTGPSPQENGSVIYDFSSISFFKSIQDQFLTNWTVILCQQQRQRGFPSVRSFSPADVAETTTEIDIKLLEADKDEDIKKSDYQDDDDDKEKSWRHWRSNGVVRGLSNLTFWADSPLGYDKGAEVIFGSLTECPSGGYYKTAIEFVCTEDVEPIFSFTFENCLTTIYVNSSKACPIETDNAVTSDDDGDDDNMIFGDDDEESSDEHFSGADINIWVVFAPLALCCCVCVRCCRRRRQMKQKEVAMQFSNVAFQPIPSSSFATTISAIQMPIYNPYVQPAQFYYHYNDQDVLSMPQRVELEQSSDEVLARELQAQFDQESRV